MHDARRVGGTHGDAARSQRELASDVDNLKSGALYEIGRGKQSTYIKPLNQTIPLEQLGPHPSTLRLVQKAIWAISLKRKFIDPLLVRAI